MLNKPKFRNIKKILVIGTNWLGDSVITIPTLYGIRSIFPDAHIAIHARHSVADIFQTVPVVDEIISCKKKEGLEKIPDLIDRALTIKKMFFNL
jgi:ADP-heptose:LPS heptosyltransferase